MRKLVTLWAVLLGSSCSAPQDKQAVDDFADECDEPVLHSLIQTRIDTQVIKSANTTHHSKASALHSPWKRLAESSVEFRDRRNVTVQVKPRNDIKTRSRSNLKFSSSRAKRYPNRAAEASRKIVRRQLSQVVVAPAHVNVRSRSHGATLLGRLSLVARDDAPSQLVRIRKLAHSHILGNVCLAVLLAILVLAPLGLWLSQDRLPSESGTEDRDPDKGSEKSIVGDSARSDNVKRTCYVCMDAPITTASLPCRHSSMCTPCAEQVLQSSRRCPLCRNIVDTWLEGDYDSDFVNLAPRLVASTAVRIRDARGVVYGGMYDHIRCLVLVALFFATMSAYFFTWMHGITIGFNLATIFAVLAFLTGYIPWFAVTVAAFEREERGDAPRQALLSEADCARPHILLVKVLLIVVLAPLALIVFFLPYLILVVILRPFNNYVLPWLVSTFLSAIFDVCFYSFMYVFRPCYVATLWILEKSARGLTTSLVFVWQCGLVPTGIAIWNCVVWASGELYLYVLVPIGNAAHAIGIATYDYVLAPLCWGLAVVGNVIFDYILTPFGHCIASLCVGVHELAAQILLGVAAFGTFLYQYGLVPVSRTSGICIAALRNYFATVAIAVEHGLTVTLEAAYTYILAPVGSCIDAVFTAVYFCVDRVLNIVMGAIYEYVLRPIARAVATASVAVYVYVLAPIGMAIWGLCASIGTAIWAICAAIGSACWTGCLWFAQTVRDVGTSFGL